MPMKSPKMVGEFKDFLMKTNMFALAMGVVIGAAVGDVVKAIVADLIMPVIAVIIPKDQSWTTYSLDIWRFKFTLGHLAWAMLYFVIIAGVVFALTKIMLRAMPPAPAAPSKSCPQCMEAVHVDAKKCKFCTSAL